MSSTFDTSARPLIRIQIEAEPTLDAFQEIFNQVEEELARFTSICVLVDARETKRIDLSQVKRIAEFGERNDKLLGAYIRVLAFVIPSAMVRGALKVAFQLKVPPHPVHICQTEAQARTHIDPVLAIL